MAFNGYLVRNVGAQLYADLRGSNFQPPTDVLIFTLNQENGTRNQNRERRTNIPPHQWRLIPVDAGANLYTIQSVLTGQFAATSSVTSGAKVQSGLTSQAWQVIVTDTFSRNYIIKAPNTNLVWSVPSGSGSETVITLDNQTSNNTYQQWTLTTIV
ncbi:hypothetical protein F5I97DRAFT_1827076 [Phlebopus sp. FC_14]|nr:hypothetical protein F5I97DRAFT_1827076 [Phlebopus sp. FC_14]